MEDMQKVDFIRNYPSHEFTLMDIVRNRLIPWAQSYRALVRLIKMDMAGENLLQTKVEKYDRYTRYIVRGSNLLKYLKKYESVGQLLTRKNHVRSKQKAGDGGKTR
jgi:hypothetical protein